MALIRPDGWRVDQPPPPERRSCRVWLALPVCQLVAEWTVRLKVLSTAVYGRWGALVPLTIAVALMRITMTIVLPYDRVVNLFQDDAFYYFGVARHIAHGDGSTFNSLDPTNGYHPLWLLLLVPIFGFADGRAALVEVTILSGALFVLSGLLLKRLGDLLGSPHFVTTSAAPLLLVGAVGPSLWFAGMETGLLLAGMLAVAVFFVRWDGLAAPDLSSRNTSLLGVLIVWVILARLDAVFPVALLGLLVMWTWRTRARIEIIRLGLGMVGPPVVALSVYLAVNVLIFETALPVSGQAKALGGDSINFHIGWQFITSPLFAGGVPSYWGAVAVLVVPLAAVWARSSPFRDATRFALVILLGGVLTILYYALTSTWKLWPWYFYSAPLALALAGPALLIRFNVRQRSAAALTIAASLSVLVLSTANAAYLSSADAIRGAWIESGPRVAAQLASLDPVDAPIAMGDRAGSLGFHLTRPLVHLEGLVNSPEYLDALREHNVNEFLKERRVGFYARADTFPGRPKPEVGPACVEFLEPEQGAGIKADIVVCAADLVTQVPLSDGTAYRVWRYRSELNG